MFCTKPFDLWPARLRLSVRDLKSVVFSAGFAPEPIEAPKYKERPLKKELFRLRVSPNDLKYELFSERLDPRASELVRVTARPFV